MKVLPYGERAVLVEPDDPHDVPALRAVAAARGDVIDAVAGAQTVLAVFADRVPADIDWSALSGVTPPRAAGSIELPVVYDGPDLAAVADATGLSAPDVITRHCSAEYTVRFCGFSPGFAYLDGLDASLQVPRHSSPRTAVPAGSVAVAGPFTGVYPRSSPGGWQLLGRTDAQLWDVDRDPPALLVPGTRVRFVRA
jgi:KipI family sensor histidine kinase inhibitor